MSIKIKTKYKHIQFDLVDNDWYCYNKSGMETLGRVYYDTEWNGWVWGQEKGVRFSISCIDDLSDFMKQLK